MELHQQIEHALKEAMREKHETKKDALRMLLTALKLKEKEIRRQPNEVEIQQTIATLIKQRRDSAEQYKAGGRPDLASKKKPKSTSSRRSSRSSFHPMNSKPWSIRLWPKRAPPVPGKWVK